jgi:hypothetical protein
MAFKQYTHCTPTADFDPLNQPLAKVMILGGLVAMITSIFAQALVPGSGIFFVLFGSVSLLAAIINTFEYLLGGKLICLGGDKLAIGKVLTVELPGSKEDVVANIDNDYSINMLLCPHQEINYNPKDPIKNFEAVNLDDSDPSNPSNFQDFLVQEQTASSNHGIPYTGYESPPFVKKPNFHIELEGARIQNMYIAFLAAWALLVIIASVALAVASIPALGWLLALLVMLFGAAVAAGIAALTYVASSDGSLDDVDPSIGELHTGDLIIAYGTWTYDSGHNYPKKVGWNELHPVKFLSKGNILQKDAEGYSFEIPTNQCLGADQAKLWQEKIEEALNMPDLRNEEGKNPLIGSSYHPLIDGCEPEKGNPEVIK